MTENQEKELFSTLGKLVTGVNVLQNSVGIIQTDVRDIKATQGEHSRKLDTLNAKVDSIAEKVIENDKRQTVVEKDVAELRGRIH
jgi:hypothetical protein